MRAFRLTPEHCLSEISLIALRKSNPEIVEKKVKTMTGISLRKFATIRVQRVVRSKGRYKVDWDGECLADCVTGSVYLDGRCLSSDKMCIVETDETPHCNIKEMMASFAYGKGSDYEI